MDSKVNLFPNDGVNPTIKYSDSSKVNLGVCFSDGGTRTFASCWGQYLGLKTLGLNDAARYISAVSGGAWSSSVYCFLPLANTTEQLLGDYHPPETLSLSAAPGKFDVNTLGDLVYGQASAASPLTALLKEGLLFLLSHEKSEHKFLWATVIAKFILEPFGLRFPGNKPWQSDMSFTQSEAYLNEHFPPQAPNQESFLYPRPGRPFLIMNDNIMKRIEAPGEKYNVVMVPNQSTPIGTGGKGITPQGYSRNGFVESYGNHGQLKQVSAIDSPVNIELENPFSLIDAVSSSSAFFAITLASHLKDLLQNEEERKKLVESMHDSMPDGLKKSFLGRIKGAVENLFGHLEEELIELAQKLDLDQFVPAYNVWPLGENSQNQEELFTDGGSLDHTGILGLLSQTDEGGNEQPIKVLSFDNTHQPIIKVDGKIVAGAHAAPMFGLHYNDYTGEYRPFSDEEKDATNEAFIPTSLIQIFDNSPDAEGRTPFEVLVNDLYNSNSENGTKEGAAPAWCQLKLTTVANSLAAISAEREVDLLFVQNALMSNWQDAIGDAELRAEIAAGQHDSALPTKAFKNFPFFDLFFKMGLEPKESNSMSQMWSWAIADERNELSRVIKAFYA